MCFPRLDLTKHNSTLAWSLNTQEKYIPSHTKCGRRNFSTSSVSFAWRKITQQPGVLGWLFIDEKPVLSVEYFTYLYHDKMCSTTFDPRNSRVVFYRKRNVLWTPQTVLTPPLALLHQVKGSRLKKRVYVSDVSLPLGYPNLLPCLSCRFSTF